MWLSRLPQTEMACTLFEEHTLDDCALLMQQNLKGWQAYLANKTNNELMQTITFWSAWETVPQKRVMQIDDVLIHLINHSTYHRSQIVALIKGKVATLPLITYIIYASTII